MQPHDQLAARASGSGEGVGRSPARSPWPLPPPRRSHRSRQQFSAASFLPCARRDTGSTGQQRGTAGAAGGGLFRLGRWHQAILCCNQGRGILTVPVFLALESRRVFPFLGRVAAAAGSAASPRHDGKLCPAGTARGTSEPPGAAGRSSTEPWLQPDPAESRTRPRAFPGLRCSGVVAVREAAPGIPAATEGPGGCRSRAVPRHAVPRGAAPCG